MSVESVRLAAALNITAQSYNRTFGQHAFVSAVNFLHSNYVTDAGSNNPGYNTGNNIFYHFQNISGRANYTYNDRYTAKLAFGSAGSDNYAPRQPLGILSGAGFRLGDLKKESFLANNKLVNYLKLRVSAGLSANDFTTRGRYLYQQYFFPTEIIIPAIALKPPIRASFNPIQPMPAFSPKKA